MIDDIEFVADVRSKLPRSCEPSGKITPEVAEEQSSTCSIRDLPARFHGAHKQDNANAQHSSPTVQVSAKEP